MLRKKRSMYVRGRLLCSYVSLPKEESAANSIDVVKCLSMAMFGTPVGSYSQLPRPEMRSHLDLTKKTFSPFIFSFSLWSFVRDINKIMEAHVVARLTLGIGKTYIPANQHPASYSFFVGY